MSKQPLQNCVIYRGSKKYDSYLYVEEKDNFDRVPDGLLKLFGRPEYVMVLELSAARKLAQADVEVVMQQLSDNGYYLQMPPKEYENNLGS